MSEPTSAPLHELISFRVGEQYFCVDIMAVRELRGWTEATPLPRAPAYVTGVINLRGEVLPVVDQRRRFDNPIERKRPDLRRRNQRFSEQ